LAPAQLESFNEAHLHEQLVASHLKLTFPPLFAAHVTLLKGTHWHEHFAASHLKSVFPPLFEAQ
jgi:hypothetical protein